MSVIFQNTKTKNRFQAKHLCILLGATSLSDLVKEGTRIFNARLLAAKGNKTQSQIYGQTKASANSLIVLALGSVKQLELAIVSNNYKSGIYDIPSGALFSVNSLGCTVGTAGNVELEIRLVNGKVHEVYHLKKLNITTTLAVGNAAMSELMVQSFAPKISDLQVNASALKHVTTVEKGGIIQAKVETVNYVKTDETGGIVVLQPTKLYSSTDLMLAALIARKLDQEDDT